jgi:riboflavin synthase
MFTGLIQAIGSIVSVRPLAGGAQAGMHIEIDAQALAPRPIVVGDSIAVNGVCLTAVDVDGHRFGADVSRETLSKTNGLDRLHAVNLETALGLGDKLGGHLVSGHVDGVGTLVRCTPVGESVEFLVQAPAHLARLLAVKGSVAVDGVSLTINRVDDLGAAGCVISINLVPHTLAATTLKELSPGSPVNLEVDMIARYVARMLERAD